MMHWVVCAWQRGGGYVRSALQKITWRDVMSRLRELRVGVAVRVRLRVTGLL